MLGTIVGARDFKRIVTECSLDITPEQLQEMHSNIQKDNTMDFLTIDLSKTKPSDKHLKYRKNFQVTDTNNNDNNINTDKNNNNHKRKREDNEDEKEQKTQ